jgi:hypothetical protein
MKPWEANSTPDEPTHDPEIQQWFQALGPPPVQPASPYLQAKVRARILDKKTRPRLASWMNTFMSPVWASALAAALVLSLSANVWWGLTGQAPQEVQVASETSSLPVYQFQARMRHAEAVEPEMMARVPVVSEPVGRAFASHQDRRVAFFRLGTVYADALAALHSHAPDAAGERLTVLMNTLHRLQAPDTLGHYLRELLTLVQNQAYPDAELAKFLALFEPLYNSAYDSQEEPVALSLFQIGAWLENVALAAATHDPVLQRQTSALVSYQDDLARLQAPSKVLDAFTQLRALIAQPTLTEQDWRQVRLLVQTIQSVLGVMAS